MNKLTDSVLIIKRTSTSLDQSDLSPSATDWSRKLTSKIEQFMEEQAYLWRVSGSPVSSSSEFRQVFVPFSSTAGFSPPLAYFSNSASRQQASSTSWSSSCLFFFTNDACAVVHSRHAPLNRRCARCDLSS